jgi:hypothetical protein
LWRRSAGYGVASARWAARTKLTVAGRIILPLEVDRAFAQQCMNDRVVETNEERAYETEFLQATS